MINIEPGSKEHMRSTNYSKSSLDNWKDELTDKLKRTLDGIEPVVKEITVYNNTKTARVTVSVINGHMHVSVSDPEEVYKPIQLKPGAGQSFCYETAELGGHCLICGGTSNLYRYRLPMDPPFTVYIHNECAKNLARLKEQYGTDSETQKEEQKTEPSAGDRSGRDPEGV